MPPTIALRTYRALRLGMVAVILGLGIAVSREILTAPGDCVNSSISAYYYTPVRSVFVGALVALALGMFALWGKTVVEDICLNLAAMLAPVVAFVPTLNASYCSLPSASETQSEEEKAIADRALIAANSDAVNNNFFTFLVVILIVLVAYVVIVAAELLYRRSKNPTYRLVFTRDVKGYIVTWVAGLGLWFVGLIIYNYANDPNDQTARFDHGAHKWSAYVMFGLVIGAVIAAGIDQVRRGGARGRKWVWIYWGLGGAMIAAFFVFLLIGWRGEDAWWITQHKTFLLEAAEIIMLAVFWAVQTVDRRKEGAPTAERPWW